MLIITLYMLRRLHCFIFLQQNIFFRMMRVYNYRIYIASIDYILEKKKGFAKGELNCKPNYYIRLRSLSFVILLR
jgi:hypothetical protein